MASVELLKGIKHSGKALRILKWMEKAVTDDGDTLTVTTSYKGQSDWLILYGVGATPHDKARQAQRERGHSFLLDLGYTNRQENYRVSIDDDHPHRLLDKTPSDRLFDVELKDTHDPRGHIVVVGMGIKSKRYLGLDNWEERQMAKLRKEFPLRRIILKEKKDPTPFDSLLQGAALVVARHSNCCVDAAIHNVPFRCEDGAAYWLKDLRDRELFLRKLAYWQCNTQTASNAWRFAKWVIQ